MANSGKRTKEDNEATDTRPDAWERFEHAVDAAVKNSGDSAVISFRS